MNQKQSKLQYNQQQEHSADLQHTAGTESAREFDTVEQMLREDAAATRVPPAVEERLSHSIRQQPQPRRTWWRRWHKS